MSKLTKTQTIEALLEQLNMTRKELADELRTHGVALSPNQISLYRNGWVVDPELQNELITALRKILGSTQSKTDSMTMFELAQVWSSKLAEAGLVRDISSVTQVLRDGGVAPSTFGRYLALNQKPKRSTLVKFESLVQDACALARKKTTVGKH